MNTLTNTYFEDMYKGKYNFNQLKEDPEIRRRIHNLFTTVVNHKDKKELRFITQEKTSYQEIIDKYKLEGAAIEARKDGYEYKYTLVIQTESFLNNLSKFYIGNN